MDNVGGAPNTALREIEDTKPQVSAPARDSKEAFVKDFVAACNKVMNLGRYDLG